MKLSIVIPAFNEEKTIGTLIQKLIELDFLLNTDCEFIFVDDASSDETLKVITSYNDSRIKIYKSNSNCGKGSAVQKGIKNATGQYILIQDADLEYDPSDIRWLNEVALRNPGACIYGSRVKGAKNQSGIRKYLRIWPKQSISAWAFNQILSIWCFVMLRVWITDNLTGYKLYPRDLFLDWNPNTNGFETDHEITCRIINNGGKILEVPISYIPRSKSEGKKIRALDGWKAIKTFWAYRK